MKNLNIGLIICLFYFFYIGCDNRKDAIMSSFFQSYTKNDTLNVNLVVERYDDGTIKEEKLVTKNGKLHGPVLSYYPSGKLMSIQNWVSGVQNGYYIELNEDGTKSTVGQMYDNYKVGNWQDFYYDHIMEAKQFIILNDKSYFNQDWCFDDWGNLRKNRSNYFTMKSESGDTLDVNKFYNFDVTLDAPYFNGAMMVAIGNYDENFRLLDSLTVDTFYGNNQITHCKIKFSECGEQILRAVVIDRKYRENPSDTMLFWERKLYLRKSFTILPMTN